MHGENEHSLNRSIGHCEKRPFSYSVPGNGNRETLEKIRKSPWLLDLRIHRHWRLGSRLTPPAQQLHDAALDLTPAGNAGHPSPTSREGLSSNTNVRAKQPIEAHLTPPARSAGTPLLLDPSACAQGIAQERGQHGTTTTKFFSAARHGAPCCGLRRRSGTAPWEHADATSPQSVDRTPDNGTCLLFPLAIYWRGG